MAYQARRYQALVGPSEVQMGSTGVFCCPEPATGRQLTTKLRARIRAC